MNATSTAKSLVSVARDRNVTLLAAGFAYYAFVSVVPLLVLVLVVGSVLGGEAFTGFVLSRVGTVLSESGAAVVEQALSGGAGRTGAGAVSLLLVVWSAIKVVRGLDVAFAEIYAVGDDPSLLEQVRDGLVVFLGVGLAIALMVAVGAVLGTDLPVAVPYPNLLGSLTLVAGLVAVFLPLYYVLPPVDVSLRRALPGTILAAVGFLVLQFVFQAYLAGSGKYAAYGFLGAVLLFVTYLYFAGILLLVGAVLNHVLGRRTAVP